MVKRGEFIATVEQLHNRLEQVIRRLDDQMLHWKPNENAWSIAQILAHIAEFEHFFSQDILQVAHHPLEKFGRTVEHEDRIKAVQLTGQEAREQLMQATRRGREEVLHSLHSLSDSDLQIEGFHAKFRYQTIEWQIQHFITEHLEKHIEQIQRTQAAYHQ
ncbi:DinB family protein [Sulfoacidibacillus thermotolerans]|uniref:DinB-like domain-containing protein n=1 Tax=Sulfoacidibacillus thermotolerans TaxID=1765684 RepID=A0A2U3D771_SULT2|nr:DinB family protein [Sulfoacidibacillus thermotolerans]PWI57126.1 hypothetical protein BM613_10245 [Sulfoacidibacillus thermotolerans]